MSWQLEAFKQGFRQAIEDWKACGWIALGFFIGFCVGKGL